MVRHSSQAGDLEQEQVEILKAKLIHRLLTWQQLENWLHIEVVDRSAVEKIEQNWQSILDLVNAAHISMELVGDDAKWAKKKQKK